MDKRIITTTAGDYDSDIEISLRPDTLDTYIGQDKVKENLRVFIEAAKKEGSPWTMCFCTGLRDWEKRPSQI